MTNNKPLVQQCIKQGNCELKNRHSVVMVLLLVALMGCTRAGVQNLVEEIDDPNPSRKYAEMYTKNLHGEFKWKRFSYIGPFNSFDTTFYDDTVVAIQVINDTAVSFMGKTFEYIDSSYKTHGVYIYTTDTSNALVYANKSVQGMHESEFITYYYRNNTLYYVYGAGGRGGSSAYVLYTP